MAEIITVETLASYPGVTMSPNADTNTLVVELANGLVSDIIGTLDPVPTRARAITFEIAARALRNPKGLSSESKKIDDWTKTERYAEGAKVRAGVYLTDEETAELEALLGEGMRAIGSIRMHVPGFDRRYGTDRC